MKYTLCAYISHTTKRFGLYKNSITIIHGVDPFVVHSVANRDWHILSNEKMTLNTRHQWSFSGPKNHTHIDKYRLGLFNFCHCELCSDGYSTCCWCQASRRSHHTRTQMFQGSGCSSHDWGKISWKGQGCIFITPSAVEIDRFKIMIWYDHNSKYGPLSATDITG